MNFNIKDELKVLSSRFIPLHSKYSFIFSDIPKCGGWAGGEFSVTDALLSRSLGNILTCVMFGAQHLK